MPEPKNIIYIGEKPAGVNALKILIDSGLFRILCVLTHRADHPRWWPRPWVSDVAREYDIPTFSYQDTSYEDVIAQNSIWMIFIGVSSWIVPQKILEVPEFMTIGLHNAPLPEYKGCNCTAHAILNDEKQFGCTLFETVEKVDAGRIAAKRMFDVPSNCTNKELYDLTLKQSSLLVEENLSRLYSGQFDWGSNGKGKYYSQTSLESKEIPAHLSSDERQRYIRSRDFEPFEPAYDLQDGVKIHYRFLDGQVKQVAFSA